MKLTLIKILSLLSLLLIVYAVYQPTVQPQTHTSRLKNFPSVILWAWERPEDLRFLNPEHIGVAFLAQTINLTRESVQTAFRQQPLKVHPSTKLIAVTRIETHQPALNSQQHDDILRLVLNTLKLKNVAAIQIDFDAKVSQRVFYRQLLNDLRTQLPKEIPLSITALASFCLSDAWIKDLPIDEAVPMIFRMGTDSEKIKNLLKNGTDFSIPLCQHSYGMATDEPLTMQFDRTRRLYLFKSATIGWQKQDLEQLNPVLN